MRHRRLLVTTVARTLLDIAATREQIEIRKIAVEPADWAVVVGSLHDAIPCLEDSVAVELATETSDAFPYPLLLKADRETATVRGTTGGINGLERQYERSQLECRLDGIAQSIECCQLARDPPHDAPRVGKHFFGIARRDRYRHGKREAGREDREPLLLLSDELD